MLRWLGSLCALVGISCIGCGSEVSYDKLVTIRDPLEIATDATDLYVGDSLEALQPRPLGGLEFFVTIGVNNSGPMRQRVFWAEARASHGAVRARGFTLLDFDDANDRSELMLNAVCDAQQRCPAPVETSVCCVGPNVCVAEIAACPPDSTPQTPGFALAFEPGQRVTIPGFNVPAGLGNNDGLTIEAWVKVGACPGPDDCRGGFVSKGGDFGLRLTARNGGNILEARVANEMSQRISPQAASTFASEWTHVAVTYDGAAVRLFVDGTSVATAPQSGPLATGTDPLIFGHPEVALMVDDVRIWDRARSPAQLTSTRRTRLSGTEPGLVAYFPLDEGTGQSAADATDNGRDGLLGSTAAEDAADPEWIAREL